MVLKLGARLPLWLGSNPAEGATRSERLAALLPAAFAGTIGVVGLVLSAAFIKDKALGYSEGLMAALVLIAVERHLDGHRRQAFALGFLAANTSRARLGLERPANRYAQHDLTGSTL